MWGEGGGICNARGRGAGLGQYSMMRYTASPLRQYPFSESTFPEPPLLTAECIRSSWIESLERLNRLTATMLSRNQAAYTSPSAPAPAPPPSPARSLTRSPAHYWGPRLETHPSLLPTDRRFD